MHRPFARNAVTIAVLSVCLCLNPLPAGATCGGGGGGGMGGATAGRGEQVAAEAYHVPWKVVGPSDPTPDATLRLYWFPASAAEAKTSDLLTSRTLTLSSARCVAMVLVTPSNGAIRGKYSISETGAAVVLADSANVELGRVAPEGGAPRASQAERLLEAELGKRENAAKIALDTAKDKLDKGDADGAAAAYTQVWEQRCVAPDPAKKAAKALKKMGRPVAESSSLWDGGAPVLTGSVGTEIVRTMNAGLAAERDGKITEAQRLYAAAERLDPADPVPVRFLGELFRHQTGDWEGARDRFRKVLAMPADPISRAVALHGLGKMTIHDGRFAEGLALFQQSLDSYPLALTYRNLAVYWNSEKDHQKAYGFVKQAMELDPDDEYNQIFAATYLVELGKPDEALEVARRHEGVLAASYNLAAIHAQLGDKNKTLELLKRHFFVYEQFDAVRAKEMQEARVDVAFERFHQDPDFVALTTLASRKPS